MIEPDKRKAIWVLHNEGVSIRQISRMLSVDRGAVRDIIKRRGEVPDSSRNDRIELDSELIIRLYAECDGYVQRIREKLVEEYKIQIGYSTLTRKIRELELGKTQKSRCDRRPDEPGAEMQHDTTDYKITIDEKRVHVIASLIYMRYSKMRYLKFYPAFDRFRMKCFLHEGLTFLGFSAPVCIIDNTNLARLRGTGKKAVIVPEMEQFAKQYAFEFVCHEINHPNRKAGNERGFWTVETNFFPGRSFQSLEDLNAQAFEWATVRMSSRPLTKAKLIPEQMFEYEKAFLTTLPSYIPAPYRTHERRTDQYGYISFDGNYYWIPGKKRFDVKVIEYDNSVKIYLHRELLIEYQFPPYGTKNQLIAPPGEPQPKYQPKHRKRPTADEEKLLRSVSGTVGEWMDFALEHRSGSQKHNFIRQLYRIYRKLSRELFEKTIQRAKTYNIKDIDTIERIAVLQMREYQYRTPDVFIDENLQNRSSYIEGCYTDDVDLSVYKINEEDN
jgi:hypothetical protein